MQTATLPLLANASATSDAKPWPGGQGVFYAAGTFGGATVSLQFLGPDGATWITAGTDTTLTAAGGGVFNLPPVSIRAAVTGGAPSGLYVKADRIPV